MFSQHTPKLMSAVEWHRKQVSGHRESLRFTSGAAIALKVSSLGSGLSPTALPTGAE